MEIFGFVLWEGITLLFVGLAGLALLAIRRKSSGQPAFSRRDWQLYFGPMDVGTSKLRLCFKLSAAVVSCLLVGLAGKPMLGQLGAGIGSAAFLLTCLGIVKFSLK